MLGNYRVPGIRNEANYYPVHMQAAGVERFGLSVEHTQISSLSSEGVVEGLVRSGSVRIQKILA